MGSGIEAPGLGIKTGWFRVQGSRVQGWGFQELQSSSGVFRAPVLEVRVQWGSKLKGLGLVQDVQCGLGL